MDEIQIDLPFILIFLYVNWMLEFKQQSNFPNYQIQTIKLIIIEVICLKHKDYKYKIQNLNIIQDLYKIGMLLNIFQRRMINTVTMELTKCFCSNRDYFQNKKLRQIQKCKTLFKPEEQKLKQLNLNFKVLSPTFFSKSLPLKQRQKIQMSNKQANLVDNSYVKLQIPLSTDQQIKNALVRLTSNQVRIGRMLECMDSIAGIVGYRHCFGSLMAANPFILVTGCVDSINLFQPITIDKDIKMQGYVNYVGKTSMEIQINLFQQNMLKSNALFTMISRNAKDPSKGYVCPKLLIDHLPQPELSKAKKRLQQGYANVERRKKQMASSYLLKQPEAEDITIIHNIFIHSAERAKESIQTEKTLVTNVRLMHVQQRNIHNKIFGGFLMREMIQTGWVVASKFACSDDLHIQDITDVYFMEPVQIGCHLDVTGRVSYTRGNIMIVTMQATTISYGNDHSQKRCCHLQIFFKCGKDQKKVFPKTYENAMYYLKGRNQFRHAFPTVKIQM